MRKSTTTGTHASTEKTAEATVAAPGFTNIADKLKLPNVDLKGMLNSRRKDIDTLRMANEQAYLGMQALACRQAEILSAAINEWHAGTKEVLTAHDGPARLSLAATRAQEAFGQVLGHTREIAEIAAKSHEAVLATLAKRVREGLEEVRDQIVRKP